MKNVACEIVACLWTVARKERRKTWSGVQADRLLRLSSDVDELLDSADALTDTLQRTRRLFDYPTSTTLL